MPHATETLTNGEKPSSQFISHLTSYPAVNDSIETFKSNPYGKKSIELADGVYSRFGKPVEPYLETPYSYAKPYVQKADELADSGLNTVESHFPIVKEDTHTIVDTAKSYIWWPYNYVSGAYEDEYNKTAKHNERGQGITTTILAIVSTELRIASDFFHAVADILGPKYEESKKKGSEYIKDLENKAEHYKQIGQDKVNEYTKLGQAKADEYTKAGQQKTEELKKQGEETKEEAKKQAQGAKEEAQKKTQK
ncbi:hypothetical protein M409DRAFT_15687 [Zasmidium cellare ATCC 36951]|uniref:Uncharacterized protein n=1 Tax=Zasmidium cellare ATCC 36951 TaxID=1080233 RepID=A0A6A6D2R5_ZASCE|nr:uncharacterized protein M409DRAFT_15687 [Zasmidium cellare ATCC 36951]KAF2173403.1 hypothetical protein M409DRAFT_15687 [Zasmidium cellare ATCC 36951]